MNLKPLAEYAKARSTEQTTWLGLITLLGVFGVNVQPEYATQIATLCATLFGGTLTLMPQK